MTAKTNFMQDQMDERIWSYIDGCSTPDEAARVGRLIATDPEWKSRYDELSGLGDLLKSSELESPSMRFSRNVMEEIARLHIAPATRSYINKKIVWGIGFFFIALLIGVLVYGFGQMNFNTGEQSAISEKISKIDFSKFFNNTWINIFLMVNAVLGLVLLDHYLTNKRRSFREEA